ncbi:hypothetical protein KKI24_18370 [bacterium]|nr:hypothetical protein [bacterium]
MAFLTEATSLLLNRQSEADLASGFVNTMNDILAELTAVEETLTGGDMSDEDLNEMLAEEGCH